jgi:FkbH-like protein
MPIPLKCVLVSDFTIDPLTTFFKDPFEGYSLHCTIAPVGQIRQTIFDGEFEGWRDKPEIALIWTLPENQILSFAPLLFGNHADIGAIQEEVTQFGESIKIATSRAQAVLVPTWTLPSYIRGNGMLDFRNNIGVGNTLMRMNLWLADALQGCENAYMLDVQRWVALVPEAEDLRMWYLGKIPFSRNLFYYAASEVKANILALLGRTKKLLVLDLDNTLWGGVLGDLGIEGIRLGGLDPIGEAFVDFQKHVLALKKRGVLLAIVSKNETDVALEVIEKHQEMVLRKKDFVAWRINWQDKATNIAEIVTELNLGIQSVVFIDDDARERARVAEAFPEIFVPEWPEDPVFYVKALNQLKCFHSAHVSQEDGERTEFYQDEQRRKKIRESIPSLEMWLESLELKVSSEPYSSQNAMRVVQLLNKTNQFNLYTRRMDQAVFDDYAKQSDTTILVFRCSDRIGNYGIIGLVSFQVQDSLVYIKDFLLSCRAMGREIEKAMLFVIAQYAIKGGQRGIVTRYLPTEKNRPCAHFLPDNGFKKRQEDWFICENLDRMTLPSFLDLTINDSAEKSS